MVADMAAANSTTEALCWYIDNVDVITRLPYRALSLWMMVVGAGSERVEKLEVLYQKLPGRWATDVFAEAAGYGHMDALEWLSENGAPWDEEACARAAREGHLEALEYLVEVGCPWDREECRELADLEGNDHITDWIDDWLDDQFVLVDEDEDEEPMFAFPDAFDYDYEYSEDNEWHEYSFGDEWYY